MTLFVHIQNPNCSSLIVVGKKCSHQRVLLHLTSPWQRSSLATETFKDISTMIYFANTYCCLLGVVNFLHQLSHPPRTSLQELFTDAVLLSRHCQHIECIPCTLGFITCYYSMTQAPLSHLGILLYTNYFHLLGFTLFMGLSNFESASFVGGHSPYLFC